MEEGWLQFHLLMFWFNSVEYRRWSCWTRLLLRHHRHLVAGGGGDGAAGAAGAVGAAVGAAGAAAGAAAGVVGVAAAAAGSSWLGCGAAPTGRRRSCR